MNRACLLGVVAALALTSVARAEQTCRESIGETRARELVRQCIEVSPATHPPCNAANSCDLIIGEIKRSCAMMTRAEMPGFCKPYLSR